MRGAALLRRLLPGCALLLLEDGVYAAVKGSVSASMLSARADIRRYALREDVEARGISALLADDIELVDYAGFVALTAECDAVQSWY